MTEARSKQTKKFQAETKQLLDLMINSIYINQEIFLRELISNASDAIDKLKFQGLTDQALLEGDTEFEIYLSVDENAGTFTISDNGTGMTFDEVVENIGTIAKSGTRVFLEKMKQNEAGDNPELIGQFGIGFYSAFMVADKVTLLTRAAGQGKGVKWESAGDGEYSIEEADKEKRGTSITLHLRKEFTDKDKPEENYLNRYTIQNLVKKYSDYIRHPIKLDFIKEEPSKEEGKKSTATVETRTLNSMTPLWMRRKEDISREDYQQFYKNAFHDWNEPLEVIHSKVEGMVEYTALLFIPSRAPLDFYSKHYAGGIKLYSRNVFIMDNCAELLPEYLGFVRGLVDSPDFSLNISREILQHDRQLKLIGKNLEKSVLKTLESLQEKDRKKYEEFWSEFGKAVKGGIYMDYQNKEKLEGLLLFSSSAGEGLTTLAEYTGRMPQTQKEIYYAAGKDRVSVERMPQMEVFRERGVEVLYFFDKVDEFVIDTMSSYKDKKFKSISRGELKLEEGDGKQAEKPDSGKEIEALLKKIKENLGDKVAEVKLSSRLKTAPVCLVSGEDGISLSMEQILSEMDRAVFKARRVLEVNPNHKVFSVLKNLYEKEPDSEIIKEYSGLLYDQALLAEGIPLENPVEFISKVAELMVQAQNCEQ